jgi:hypothetical protein
MIMKHRMVPTALVIPDIVAVRAAQAVKRERERDENDALWQRGAARQDELAAWAR